MPIRTTLLERALFYQLNVAPAPLLDLAGVLSYQALSTAVQLRLFEALQERPLTAAEVAGQLAAQERGIQAFLQALTTTGYVNEKDGRYANSPSTSKWLLDEEIFDMEAAVFYWNAAVGKLWPPAADIIRTGERPFHFYEWVEAQPELSHAFQTMMVTSAKLTAPDIAKKLALPAGEKRLLDIGGGHGMFSAMFCQHYPGLEATILDSPAALETARQVVAQQEMTGRIKIQEGDLWEVDWGQGYDAVLLFNLMHHFSLEANEKLLQMAAGALESGGQVAILEQIEGKVSGSASNAFVQLIALQYYLAVDGRVFSKDGLRDLLSRNGFKDIRFHSLTKSPGTSLVMATKTV